MRLVKTVLIICGLLATRAVLANEMPRHMSSATSKVAKGHLSEIPGDWRAAFSAIEPDPHPEKLTRDSHYWVSDEQRHDLFRESITNLGGIFIGLGTDVRGANIKPGAHHETLVDGDRHHRCMRKNETNVKAWIKAQFGNNGLKIMPVGTESMPGPSTRRLDAAAPR